MMSCRSLGKTTEDEYQLLYAEKSQHEAEVFALEQAWLAAKDATEAKSGKPESMKAVKPESIPHSLTSWQQRRWERLQYRPDGERADEPGAAQYRISRWFPLLVVSNAIIGLVSICLMMSRWAWIPLVLQGITLLALAVLWRTRH